MLRLGDDAVGVVARLLDAVAGGLVGGSELGVGLTLGLLAHLAGCGLGCDEDPGGLLTQLLEARLRRRLLLGLRACGGEVGLQTGDALLESRGLRSDVPQVGVDLGAFVAPHHDRELGVRGCIHSHAGSSRHRGGA